MLKKFFQWVSGNCLSKKEAPHLTQQTAPGTQLKIWRFDPSSDNQALDENAREEATWSESICLEGHVSDELLKRRLHYLYSYLSALGCKWVIEEEVYVDLDYQEEFADFYCRIPKHPPGVCGRLHFFSSLKVETSAKGEQHSLDWDFLATALAETSGQNDDAPASGNRPKSTSLYQAYLGFVVVRPSPLATFGRSVLKSFPSNGDDGRQRHFETVRAYDTHLCGLMLRVHGVPWQQQDEGVSACASVALWSLLQSLARQEPITPPSAAAVSRAVAQSESPFGRTISEGMTTQQMCHALRTFNLTPVLLDGSDSRVLNDERSSAETIGAKKLFSLRALRLYSGLFLRGRIPIILGVGQNRFEATHAVTAIGFQLPTPNGSSESDYVGDEMSVLYVNDDNYGPGVRHEMHSRASMIDRYPEKEGQCALMFPKASEQAGKWTPAVLVAKQREAVAWTRPEFLFVHHVLAAVPDSLRMSPTWLLETGMALRHMYCDLFEQGYSGVEMTVDAQPDLKWQFDAAFLRLSDYLADQESKDGRHMGIRPFGSVRGRVALSLAANVQPLPRYLGVVRILRTQNGGSSVACCDYLFDTTTAPGRPNLCVVIDHLKEAVKFNDLYSWGSDSLSRFGARKTTQRLDAREPRWEQMVYNWGSKATS